MYLTLWSPLYVYRHFSGWLRTRGNPAGTRKVATLPRVRTLDHANPSKGCAGSLREPQKLQLYLAFSRSTTPIHAEGCASRRKCATLPRVQAFDHANPWEVLRVTLTCWKKCVTLPPVPAFDHANPWEGLRVAPKMCNFTSRSSVRPR